MSTRAIIAKRVSVFVLLAGVFVLALRSVPVAAYPLQNRTQREIEQEMQDRQYKELNKRRQQDIRDETEKLFQLATELKAAVDKTNENVLSLDVVRKADEVEKLAKKVKEKMKESIAPPPRVEPVPRSPYAGRSPR